MTDSGFRNNVESPDCLRPHQDGLTLVYPVLAFYSVWGLCGSVTVVMLGGLGATTGVASGILDLAFFC